MLKHRAGNSIHAAWHFLTMASTSALHASSEEPIRDLNPYVSCALAQISQSTPALHLCHTGEAFWQLHSINLKFKKSVDLCRAGLLPLRSLWSSTSLLYTAPISSPPSTSWTACVTTGGRSTCLPETVLGLFSGLEFVLLQISGSCGGTLGCAYSIATLELPHVVAQLFSILLRENRGMIISQAKGLAAR